MIRLGDDNSNKTTAAMSDFLYDDDDNWRFERVSWLLWRLIKR